MDMTQTPFFLTFLIKNNMHSAINIKKKLEQVFEQRQATVLAEVIMVSVPIKTEKGRKLLGSYEGMWEVLD